MNNNVAPNNPSLLGDAWINLLIKIVKESTLVLRTIIASHTHTNNDDLDHHVIIS
jgi:hypothetical protein